MAAPANANNTTPFFGCKISLISKSEIRYEGILYTIDPKESTIALAKVRSFGSEDRPVERPVPPRDDVFEFIIFRASDIKDLIVDDPPPTPALTDPAIIQAHSTSTSFPSSFPQASINAAAPAPVAPVGPTAPQQTPIQQLQQAKGSSGPTGGLSVPKQNETHTDSNKSKNATSSNAPPNYSRAAGGGSGSVTQQQTRQPNQRQNLQFNKQQQNKPSGEQSQQSSQAPNRSNNQQPQQNAQNQNGYARRNQQSQSQQNRVIGENQNPNYHSRNGGQQQNQGGFRPFNSQHRFAPRQGQGQQQQPQQHQHQFSGGFRRGGGPGGVSGGPRNFISRPLNQHNGPKFPPLPDGDFDFEKAQADFKILEEKLHALKLNGSLGEVAEGPSADTTDVVVPGIPASAISVAALEQEEQELPKEACYNKQKSFFDQISCEALEREKGSSHRVDWKQERKMNRETFGAVSARRPTFFRVNNRGGGFGGGYHQHRGGYYNQRGGSGGYYQNRNYQNRQPRSQNASGAGGSNNVSSTTNSTRTPAKSTPNGVGASPSSSAAPIAIATKN